MLQPYRPPLEGHDRDLPYVQSQAANPSWSAKLAAFAALIHGALSVDAGPTPPAALLAAAALAADTAGALPMPTLGGVGPFEAGIVLGLTALQVDTARALAIGVLLHGALLGSIALTGALALIAGLALERRGRARVA